MYVKNYPLSEKCSAFMKGRRKTRRAWQRECERGVWRKRERGRMLQSWRDGKNGKEDRRFIVALLKKWTPVFYRLMLHVIILEKKKIVSLCSMVCTCCPSFLSVLFLIVINMTRGLHDNSQMIFINHGVKELWSSSFGDLPMPFRKEELFTACQLSSMINEMLILRNNQVLWNDTKQSIYEFRENTLAVFYKPNERK